MRLRISISMGKPWYEKQGYTSESEAIYEQLAKIAGEFTMLRSLIMSDGGRKSGCVGSAGSGQPAMGDFAETQAPTSVANPAVPSKRTL